MVKKQTVKVETKTEEKKKKFNLKEIMVKSLRILLALFAILSVLGTLVQVVPFTIIFIGGLIGIPAQVVLNSADFYVWVLTSLFMVGLYVYFTVRIVTYLWFVITGFQRENQSNE